MIEWRILTKDSNFYLILNNKTNSYGNFVCGLQETIFFPFSLKNSLLMSYLMLHAVSYRLSERSKVNLTHCFC